MTNRVKIIAFVSIIALCGSIYGQSGGGTIVRIPDGSSHCINASTDQVWLTLRRMIISKKKGWLTEDKSVSVFLTATLQDQSDKPPKFPLTTQATVAKYTPGQVSVPVEYSLMQGFKLSQKVSDKDVSYTGVNVDLTLLNQRGKTRWGNALTALDQFASKLPVPANPYSKGIQYVSDFANSAVETDIKNQPNDDKVRSASLTLIFAPNGQCVANRDFESTGTLAVVDQDGVLTDPGYIKESDMPNYCWKADLKPSFVLWAAPKENAKECSDATYKPAWKQVANNYVGLFLNAVPVTGHLGAEADKARDEAITRCQLHGIDDPNQCLQVK